MPASGGLRFKISLALACTLPWWASRAHAGEVCGDHDVDADDVRQTFDDDGRVLHELRLRGSEVVQENALEYDRDGHQTSRIESEAGHSRAIRRKWDGDHAVLLECLRDETLEGRTVWMYRGNSLLSIEEQFPVRRITQLSYDSYERPILRETRDAQARLIERNRMERTPPPTPTRMSLTGGAAYQSDTELLDMNAGLGIHRRPELFRYGGDPLELALDGSFKFHRAKGLTTADQTSARVGVDYHLVLPNTTVFTFTQLDRNVPANLKLNLEEAIVGVKYELVPRGQYQLDASLAPVWNLRAIAAPVSAGTPVPSVSSAQATSKLRASFRLRAGYHAAAFALLDTAEFLPTVFGDDLPGVSGFWNRTVFRNTVALDVGLSKTLALRQTVQYTRDPSMRAQATCPDSSNPLCLGYAVATTTSLVLNVELAQR